MSSMMDIINFRTAGTNVYSSTSGVSSSLLEQLQNEGIEINDGSDLDIGLDFEGFLNIMIAQLQNQTMDDTADTSEMLNQLVQMSTVQMLAKVDEGIDSLLTNSATSYAASLVGKEVTIGVVEDDGTLNEVVGTVTGAGIYQGYNVIFLGDDMYAVSDIMAVGRLPAMTETPEGEDTNTDTDDGTTETP